MRKIPLTQGKFAIVDKEDVWLVGYNWCYTTYGYAARWECGKIVFMHRMILERKLGHSNFEDTDHVNRDGIDNRKANLRPATHAQNLGNRGKQKNNTSSSFLLVFLARYFSSLVIAIDFSAAMLCLIYPVRTDATISKIKNAVRYLFIICPPLSFLLFLKP